MRLLVSVRDADEARTAVHGGADLVDAKEPAAGALGAVSAVTLTAITEALRGATPISAALGELDDPRAVAAAIAALPFRRGGAPCYAKFAVRGPVHAAPALLRAAVAAAEAHPARPRVIAATYADAPRAGVVPPIPLLRAAAGTGVHGLLLDTFAKDGRTLLDFVPADFLGAWVQGVRTDGFLCAVAGSLAAADVPLLRRLGADVFGVRGAACSGGRGGMVELGLVRALGRACADQLAPAV